MLRDLELRAVKAAVAVATAGGLEADEAVVVHSGSNVLVHLRPAPVVARVMTGTVVLHGDPERWLTREISVLGFLAPSGLAVTPSAVIAPGPHHHDGLWMTFTEWIPAVKPAVDFDDAAQLGSTLRALHEALTEFEGDLADMSDLRRDIRHLAGQLEPADASEAELIASLRARLTALGPDVFESKLPVQALHGDVSLRNLLDTDHRLVWNDFEDTLRGPVHWDLASFVGSLRSRGSDEDFIRSMLDGYGWTDEPALNPFTAAHDVYDEIWRMYDRQRRS